jgi:4-amino-4-deoxy-L-arabinose transferase-like glycosyltransferase
LSLANSGRRIPNREGPSLVSAQGSQRMHLRRVAIAVLTVSDHKEEILWAPRQAAKAIVRLMPLLIGAVAVTLRVIPWLNHYPLHRDEALYGSWARLIASGTDPLLLTTWVDKPPLVLYALAGSIRIFGTSELALRLPGMIVSILTVPLLFGFARNVYGLRVAALAATLLAVSPFAILFAPTAFTDPWLTLWVIAGAWAALTGRSFLAGLSVGLAIASKQQGLLAVPLVFALLFLPEIAATKRPGGRPAAVRFVAEGLLGFVLIFAPMTYWDSLRWSNRPSFWDRSLATYGGLSVAPIQAWPHRAAAWASQLGLLFGYPLLSAIMLTLSVFVGFRGLGLTLKINRGRAHMTAPPGLSTNDSAAALPAALDGLLILYMAGYLILHLILTFQTWDRYLLLLVPLVALTAARGISAAWHVAGRYPPTVTFAGRMRTATVIGLVAAVSWAASLGAAGRLPIGSDHGAYAGLEDVVTALRAQPADTIIYDHWLGWYYNFYLFDSPQERRWWADAADLADTAARTAKLEPQRDQWLVIPAWEMSAEPDLRRTLGSRWMALVEIGRTHRPDGSVSFTMFRIEPLAGFVRQ